MRWQEKKDAELTLSENLKLETEEHDEDYDGRLPFGLNSMTFTKEDVWRINNHSYLKGTYRRGLRKRKLFKMMDVENLAGKRLLDVGCGQGSNSVFFAMNGIEAHGFDLSPKGIEMATRIAEANGVGDLCHFQTGNASKMHFPDNHFDIVVYNGGAASRDEVSKHCRRN